MSQHSVRNPEEYVEREPEGFAGQCNARNPKEPPNFAVYRCELDAPHPEETHCDATGARW